MNKREIFEYLSPTKAGPITVRQKLRYSISGLFKNDINYSFSYECEEIGISWTSDGTILRGGFSEDIFTLFSQCKLDVSSLKSKQSEYEEVPYDKKQLKYFLQTYSSRTFEVYFTDENWRRDYWFCKQANYLEFNIYMKDEERLLIQLSPAKIMMDLMMDNSPTKRTHLLAELSGRKGVYDYFTGSYVATKMLKTLSQYYGQFGFMFSDSIIEQIGDFIKEGSGCTGEIHRKEETSADDEYSEEEEYSGYSEDEEYSRYSEDDKENASENKKLEYLSIFGLDEDAIWDDVVYARNAMLKMWHPDKWMNDERRKGIAEKQIKKINNAFDELKVIFEDAPQNQQKRQKKPRQQEQPKQQKQQKQQNSDYGEGFFSVYYDYLKGQNGKKQDYKKAYEIALYYANKNNPVAQSSLGDIYRYGYGVEQDYEKAVCWYEMAAKQNDVSAQYQLGEIYYDGLGVGRNYQEAKKWFEKAAEQDFSPAQMRLGDIYCNGLGVKRNGQEAKKWYEKAQSFVPAQERLGDMYFYGLGIERNYQEARKWYEKAGKENNYSPAQCSLGDIYRYGLGVEQNYKEARKWYERAAEQNNYTVAYTSLGDVYFYGLGVEQNYQFAKKWYEKAAEENDANAQKQLGEIYSYGYGVEVDDDEAKKWYQKAANQGNGDAAYRLGSILNYEDDDEGAYRWWTFAAEECNSADAYDRLGYYYDQDGNKEKAFEMFKKAMLFGSYDGLYTVCYRLLNGEGVPKSEEEAINILKPYLENKASWAHSMLGDYYFENGEREKAIPYLNAVMEIDEGEKSGYIERATRYIASIWLEEGSRESIDKAYQILLKIIFWSEEANKMLVEIYKRPVWGSYYLEQSIRYFLKEIVTERMAYPRLVVCYIVAQQYTLAFSVALECDKTVIPPDADEHYGHYKYVNYANLGICFLNGYGCTPDFDKAFYYFFMNNLEYCNWDENTDEKNYQDLNPYQLLAKAYCEYYGKGTDKDRTKALKTLKEAYAFENYPNEYAEMLLDYLNNHYSSEFANLTEAL